MKNDKTSGKILFVILIIFIIIGGLVIYSVKKEQKANEQTKYINNNVIALKDKNRFMTITSAINNYFNAVKYENVDNIMLILDKIYVEENNINSNNVLHKIDNYNKNYVASIRAVYQVKSYNNIYIYYVKANLIEESVLSVEHTYIREIYYKVTINENTLAFAVAPISEKEYLNGVDNNEGH